MAKTIQFDVEVDSGNSVKTLATMKQELEDINAQLEEVEVGSKAFNDLASSASKASGEIKDIERSFEGLDATQRTEAFAKGFEGIAGAVAVTAGTMALFGVESEKIGEIEQKVQGAIAIAIGARGVAEGILAAKTIARTVAEKGAAVATKAMAVAQGIFNAVMNLNPIFLLVTVLAAVTAGIYLFTKAMSSNTEEVDENTEALAARARVLEDSANFSIRIGAALGQSAERQKERQIAATKATEDRLAAELKLAETVEDRDKIFDELLKVGDDLIILELELGTIRQNEADKAKKDAEAAKKRKQDEYKKNREEAARAREDAKKVAQEIADDAALIGLSETEKAIEEENRKYDERLKILEKYNLDTENLEKIHADAIAKINADAQQKTDDAAALKRDEKQKEDEAAENAYAQLLLNIRDSVAVSQDERRELELIKLTEHYDALIAEAKKNNIDTANLEDAKAASIGLKKDEFRQNDTDKEKAYQDQIAQLAIGAAGDLISTLSSLNDLFAGESEEQQKKQFKRNQSLQIAQTVIDTYASATAAFSSLAGVPIVGPVLGGIAAAAAVTAGLANIKNIKSQKFEGTSATGGSVPSGGNQGGNTSIGSITPIGQLGEGSVRTPLAAPNQPAIKTYVLSGDVTTGQEADERINQRRVL